MLQTIILILLMDINVYLLLDQIEAHSNHCNAKKEIKGTESDPFLSVFHFLVWSQVSKSDCCQGDEAKVGTERQLACSYHCGGMIMVMMRNLSRKGNDDADHDSSNDCEGE